MNVKLLSTAGFLLMIVSPAMADKQSYCAAYATDFANAQAKDKAQWQHKYEISLQSCLSVSNPAVIETAPIQYSVKKPVTVVQPPTEIVPPEPKFTKVKLEPGSEDWNAYCTKKYTSFNVKTGMYHSLKGFDRKCVVTKP